MRPAAQSTDIAGERMSGKLVLSGRNIFTKYVKRQFSFFLLFNFYFFKDIDIIQNVNKMIHGYRFV